MLVYIFSLPVLIFKLLLINALQVAFLILLVFKEINFRIKPSGIQICLHNNPLTILCHSIICCVCMTIETIVFETICFLFQALSAHRFYVLTSSKNGCKVKTSVPDHCFTWFATFEIKTPAEMFPKFPSIIRQIPIWHKWSRKFTGDK